MHTPQSSSVPTQGSSSSHTPSASASAAQSPPQAPKASSYKQVSPPPDGQRPRLELGDAQLDEAIRQSGEQMLSLYVPQLGGNLHFFVFESRHIDGATAFVIQPPAIQSR